MRTKPESAAFSLNVGGERTAAPGAQAVSSAAPANTAARSVARERDFTPRSVPGDAHGAQSVSSQFARYRYHPA